MTHHDTWIRLIPGNPLRRYLHLFPDGIPMRDPFAMEQVKTKTGTIMAIMIVDLDRLSPSQFDALSMAIAASFNVDPAAVAAEARANGGFAINDEWVASMEYGAEGMQRTKELADFLEIAPQPITPEALAEFISDQRRRWIDGDEMPPPLPRSIEEVDPRLVTPESEAALFQRSINNMLSGYSVFDVLTGRAMADILNQLNPESEYSVAGWDDGEEEP